MSAMIVALVLKKLNETGQQFYTASNEITLIPEGDKLTVGCPLHVEINDDTVHAALVEYLNK